jgi:hypothetical protein
MSRNVNFYRKLRKFRWNTKDVVKICIRGIICEARQYVTEKQNAERNFHGDY